MFFYFNAAIALFFHLTFKCFIGNQSQLLSCGRTCGDTTCTWLSVRFGYSKHMTLTRSLTSITALVADQFGGGDGILEKVNDIKDTVKNNIGDVGAIGSAVADWFTQQSHAIYIFDFISVIGTL